MFRVNAGIPFKGSGKGTKESKKLPKEGLI
jgi:hypothetical protein